MSKLIIVRGNSGSGKTTIAKELRDRMLKHYFEGANKGVVLVPQDIIRREILRVKDEPENPSIRLIHNIASYGRSIGYDVIIEGILGRKNYGAMLNEVMSQFDEVYVYYLDISFEETLRRHKTKPNSHEFGEEQMRSWYAENDILGFANEKIFTDKQTKDEIVQAILNDTQ